MDYFWIIRWEILAVVCRLVEAIRLKIVYILSISIDLMFENILK